MGEVQSIKDFLEINLIRVRNYELDVADVAKVVFILGFTRLVIFLADRLLKRRVKQNRIGQREHKAFLQLIRYFAWIAALMISLNAIGLNPTVLLAGGTAVLVGIGLGIQDLFKDVISGIIVLWDRTITEDDIVDIGGTIGKVVKVGMRTTTIVTRRDTVMIIPNHKLTADYLINWTQNNPDARNGLTVGIAYGCDTRKAEEILLEVAAAHPDVEAEPAPRVLFEDFGESALQMSVYFTSRNLFRVEVVKSDLRFELNRRFEQEGIRIAFPQLDVWLRQGQQP